MSDPAVEAARRAWVGCEIEGCKTHNEVPSTSVAAAREALAPLREQMQVAHARYSELQHLMLDGATSAETSRYANEMAGIQYLYRLIAPLVYSAEELS